MKLDQENMESVLLEMEKFRNSIPKELEQDSQAIAKVRILSRRIGHVSSCLQKYKHVAEEGSRCIEKLFSYIPSEAAKTDQEKNKERFTFLDTVLYFFSFCLLFYYFTFPLFLGNI